MEVILWFFLLLSVNIGCGISQRVYLSGNQTWGDASNDSTCSLIDLDLSAGIEDSIDNISSIDLGRHQAAWIGAYVKRVWINFEGCYFVTLKHKDSGIKLTSPGDPAKECLRYCNFTRFVLTDDRCVCDEGVKVVSTSCSARECTDTKYTYCGRGTVLNSQKLTFHCMCRFSMEPNTSYISGDGNCLAVTYTPHEQFNATKCDKRFRPLCFDPNTKQGYLDGSENDWMRSLSECYKHNKQFAGTSRRWIGSHDGMFWVGAFSVTYKLWGYPPSTNDGCTAVSMTDNHLTPVVLPCDTLLPALCTNTSIANHATSLSYNFPSTTTSQYLSSNIDKSTTPLNDSITKNNGSVNHYIPTNTSDIQTGLTNMNTDVKNKSSVPVIVGSIVGSAVCVIVVIVLVLFLRGCVTLRKSPISTGVSQFQTNNYNPSCDTDKESDDTQIIVSGFSSNTWEYYENIHVATSRSSGTPNTESPRFTDPEDRGNIDSHRYTRADNDNRATYVNSTPEVQQQSNPESQYCELDRPYEDEHVYGQLK